MNALIRNYVQYLKGNKMQPHQQRVVDEKTELDKKLDALFAFLNTPIFAGLDAAEQLRLRQQSSVMHQYSLILAERIAAF